MKLLELNHISKAFDAKDVLKDISLDVSTGEVVSIIGPSGSGKSTLLRCAAFLELADGGDIIYNGEYAAKNDANGHAVYSDPHVLKKLRGNFGLVFQNFNLFPHYTVLKNVTDAPICVQKRHKDEVYKNARQLLDKMGLLDRQDAYPFQLSGGQQQRVSIVRALALNPKLLMFDEPTSALDPELTGEVLKVIRDLAADHMTMVIVTHEIEFARQVSSRVVFMDGGVIVEDGLPDTILKNPKNERTIAFLSGYNS